MKYVLVFLILIGFTCIVIPNAFASENLFYGISSFERLPKYIVPENSQTFEIKLQIQNGPYWLNDFKPIVDVNPKEAAPYVHIEFDQLEGVSLHSVYRINGTITVDKEIPSKMIFLNISYVGMSLIFDKPALKSGWNDSAIINIRQNISGGSLDKSISQEMRNLEMRYPEFLSFCDESKGWNFDLMPINLRLLSSLCDMNEIGFNEKYWNWLGPDLDWKNFTQNIAYEYAPTIPLFVEKGIPETIVVTPGISGRDSFPPPMFAHISFAYHDKNEIKSFYEMYTIKISGEVINQKDLVQSPLKQTKNGNHLEDIRCKSDLVLVLKKSKEFIACVKPETVSKLFDRNWALNETRIVEHDENSKSLRIQGIVNRIQTVEGFEFHLIPLPREITRIAYTGNNTLELFATKNTVSNFIDDLDGKLIEVQGNFLMEDGKFKRSFSGLPAISVQNLKVVYEPENFAYSILGGKLISVTKIPEAHGLNITLEEGSGPGEITITIPRALLDTKIGNDDDKFLVLADGIEIPYSEEKSDISRTLVIYFENVTQIIQIMSTFPI